MRKYCLVCESEQFFEADDDVLRCSNCMSLPYNRLDDIVLKHREEYRKRHNTEEELSMCCGSGINEQGFCSECGEHAR